MPRAESNILFDLSSQVSNNRFVQLEQVFDRSAHEKNLNEVLPPILSALKQWNSLAPEVQESAEEQMNALRANFLQKETPLFENTTDQFRVWDLTRPGKSRIVPTKTLQAKITHWTLTPTHILWESTEPAPKSTDGTLVNSIRSYSFATGKEELIYTETSANGGPIDRIMYGSTTGEYNSVTFEIQEGVAPNAQHKQTYVWNTKKGVWEYKDLTFSGVAKGFTFSNKRITGPTQVNSKELVMQYPVMGSTYAVLPASQYTKKVSQLAWVNVQTNKRGVATLPFLVTTDARKDGVTTTKNYLTPYASDMKIYGDRILILRMIPVMNGKNLNEAKSVSELWTYTFSTNKVQRIMKLEGYFDRIESFEGDEALLSSVAYPTTRAFTHIVLKGTPRQDYTITQKEITKHKGSKNIIGYSRGTFVLADSPFASAEPTQPDFSKMSDAQLEQFALDVLMAPRVHTFLLKK